MPGSRRLARQRVQELALSIARHASNTDDLAGEHIELQVFERGTELIVGDAAQPGDRKARIGMRRRLAVLAHWQVATDHHPRHRFRCLPRWDARPGDLPRAQHRRRVTQLLDLVELVADVEDAAAFRCKLAQHVEELADRLRRQHRRRLVHDQEARILQEAADDLDTLPLAYRQCMNEPSRIDRQPVSIRYLLDARRQRLHVLLSGQSERDVLDDGECLEQREVLEHHPDSHRACFGGIGDGNLAAFPDNPALGRSRDAVDDFHQRRLAGAVLAEHCVDLAGADDEIDAIVGDDGWIDFPDPLEDQSGLRVCVVRHAGSGWRWCGWRWCGWCRNSRFDLRFESSP